MCIIFQKNHFFNNLNNEDCIWDKLDLRYFDTS